MVLAVSVGIAAASFSISYQRGTVESVRAYFISVAPRGDRICTVFADRRAPRDGGTPLFSLDDVDELRGSFSSVATFGAEWVYDLPVSRGGTHLTAWVDGREPAYAFAAGESPAVGLPLDEDDEAERGRVCILSFPLAGKLFPEGGAVGQEIVIRDIPFRVRGVYPANRMLKTVGVAEEDRIYVPLSTAMHRLFNISKIGTFSFVVRDGADVEGVTEEVRRALRLRRGLSDGHKSDFYIVTPRTVNRVRESETATIRLAGMVVTLVALLLGGGVVTTVMLLAASQRQAELGLKRALGATRWDVFMETLDEAMITCVAGLTCGLVLGLATILVLRSLPQPPGFYPSRFIGVSWRFFAVPAAYAFALGILAALLPGFRVARLDPASALR